MRSVAPVLVAAASLVAILTGCLRGDPLDWKVRAANSRGLLSWRMNVDGPMGAENRRRLNEALSEIRGSVSGNRAIDRWLGREVTASTDEIDDALCRRIDGLLLRDVLQLGYELRVRRLGEELAGLEYAMKGNTGLVTRPDDVASRQYLDGLRERQQRRVDNYRAQLADAERELAPLLKTSGRRLLEPGGDKMGEFVETKRPLQ